MGVKFNPFIGNLDLVDSPNGEFDSIDLSGDITFDDGGTYTTTVQVVTPTADRTISFPDATGTVALVAGSSGQLTYNSSGAQAGLTSASIGSTDEINISLAGAASTPPVSFTGSWFTGGTSTTTKPQLLIEPSGTTSTAWSTSGTGLGVNAASGFSGRLLDLQTNGTSRMVVQGDGKLGLGTSTPPALFSAHSADTSADFFIGEFQSAASLTGLSNTYVKFEKGDGFGGAVGGFIEQNAGAGLKLATLNGGTLTDVVTIRSPGKVGIGTTSPQGLLTISSSGAEGCEITPRSGYIEYLNYNRSTSSYIEVRNFATAHVWTGAAGERARIDISGNLGIATTTPGDKLEIGGAGAGIILASPDGTRYRLTVANGGTLSIAAV